MTWQDHLKGDSLTWLLEPETPEVRYLALRDLLDAGAKGDELVAAREAAHKHGPIAAILNEMDKAGYWVESGPGYNPKYRSTVWSLTLLAQLGAHQDQDERIARACDYYLDQALTAGGQFSASGTPAGTMDCLQGNLCWALLELGCQDARLEKAFDWLARSVTGEGVGQMGDKASPMRFNAGKCGPGFRCGANDKQPCAWGGTKVMLAFGKLPRQKHTPLIERAIQQGVDFFFSADPAAAPYPNGYAAKPSGNWWKFGFPVFYVTDLLQIVEALASLGYAADLRLANAYEVILSKQDANGRWLLEYDYAGKTWVEFGEKKKSNKWVTLRALRVLKALEAA